MSKQEVRAAVARKLNVGFRDGPHATGWYIVRGRKVARVSIPWGAGDLAPWIAKEIRSKLYLSPKEFARLVGCPMGGAEYYEVLRRKGLID